MSHYKARPCEVCGTLYQGTYSGQRTCGRQCGAALNSRRVSWPSERIYPTRCPNCQTWTTWRQPRLYCSQACIQQATKIASQELHRATYISVSLTNPEVQHACPECGHAFTTSRFSSRTIYCSEACGHRAAKRNRRHRIRANGKAERFTLHKIAERDRWRCHLCKRRVTKGQASIDHLIPVSDGGTHTRANVALAHHLCNSLRGAGGVAQLSLIG